MKKTLLFGVIILILLCSMMLTACDNWIEVTIYCGEDSFVKKYYKGDGSAPLYLDYFDLPKRGYYFTGFYDQEVGGNKYYNADGSPVSEWTWDETYPTALYGQWKPASGYESKTKKWKTFSFFTHQGSFSDGKCVDLELNDEEITLIDGNMDKNIEVHLTGRIQAPADRIELFLQDKNTSGYEVYAHKTITTTPGIYVDFSFTITCSAKIFAENYYLTFRFRGEYTSYFTETYVKEFQASFKVL